MLLLSWKDLIESMGDVGTVKGQMGYTLVEITTPLLFLRVNKSVKDMGKTVQALATDLKAHNYGPTTKL